MASTSSSKSSARFARIVVVAALAVAVSVGFRDDGADACVGGDPTIAELTTFDPHVIIDVGEGLDFDPFVAGFGEGCVGNCAITAMTTDWHGYPKDATSDKDWEQVLFK